VSPVIVLGALLLAYTTDAVITSPVDDDALAT
jgi:hypothetical protein